MSAVWSLEPSNVVITTGFNQGSTLVLRALAAAGLKRIALEDPTSPEQRTRAEALGLKTRHIPVDEDGLRVEELTRTSVDAVVLTPAHQFPTGAVLSGERRTALLGWVRSRKAFVFEDDYDAEIRYDRAAIGALQGLEPDRVIYAGSASKTLAPALRLGWLVVPRELHAAIDREKRLADWGGPRIDQHAFARFLARGDFDRHLRRMRSHYSERRDAMLKRWQKRFPMPRCWASPRAFMRPCACRPATTKGRSSRKQTVAASPSSDWTSTARGREAALQRY